MSFPGGSDDKESDCKAGDPGLIPGSGRFSGGGHINPFQLSCLENPMDRRAWQATVHPTKELDMTKSNWARTSVKRFFVFCFSEDCWFPCILILAKTFTAHIGLHVDKTSCPVTGHIWTSLVAETVKNLPAVMETWVWSLFWEDPLEKEMATHSSILTWEIPMVPMERGAWQAIVHEVAKSQTWLSD